MRAASFLSLMGTLLLLVAKMTTRYSVRNNVAMQVSAERVNRSFGNFNNLSCYSKIVSKSSTKISFDHRFVLKTLATRFIPDNQRGRTFGKVAYRNARSGKQQAQLENRYGSQSQRMRHGIDTRIPWGRNRVTWLLNTLVYGACKMQLSCRMHFSPGNQPLLGCCISGRRFQNSLTGFDDIKVSENITCDASI